MQPMQTAIRRVLSRYATFSGRASRPEFWWWALAAMIAQLVAQLIDGALIMPLLGFERFQEDGAQLLAPLLSLAIVLPSLAVSARRLHDTGRSGWWLLLMLIPIIGSLVLLWFYIQRSDGPNEYGDPDPLPA